MSSVAFSIALQDDGAILLAGVTSSLDGLDGDFALWRFDATGAPDPSFGDDGLAVFDLSAGDDFGIAALVQPDGKIIGVGQVDRPGEPGDGPQRVGVVRLNADGTLDTGFGDEGIEIISAEDDVDLGVTGAALQTDGKILLAATWGSGASRQLFVLRQNADGSLDTTFNSNGTVFFDQGSDSGAGLVQLADGDILVTGSLNNDVLLARLNADGTLDTGFGDEGIATTAIGSATEAGFDLAVQSDGKVVVAATTFNGVSHNLDFAVLRYNTDGSLDESFGGGDGIVTTDVGTWTGDLFDDFGMGVALQSDGKIVVTGWADNGTGSPDRDMVVLRYTTDGILDPTFFGDGVLQIDLGGDDQATDIATRADGSLVVAGVSQTAFDGQQGALLIIGTEGSDSLAGASGNDTLVALAGDDTLEGSGGADSLVGGDGNDVYYVDDPGDVVVEASDAPEAFGLAQFAPIPGGLSGAADEVRAAIDYALANAPNVENLRLEGSAQTGIGSAVDNLLVGNALANTLNAGQGNDTVDGGDGDDVINGGQGNDSLEGGAGNDVMNGKPGDDTLVGGDGADFLGGGSENDLLIGGNDNDLLVGGAGDDALNAGQGDDTLDGSDGADVVNGGQGNDSLVGGAGADVMNGKPGNDTLFGGDGADFLGGGEGNDSLAAGDGNDMLVGGAGEDSLMGDFGFDSLVGADGNDLLIGGMNADTLDGGNGDDDLRASKGRDVLLGGEGNDVLAGGQGADTLTGGTDADRFVYNNALDCAPDERILDFNTDEDLLDLSALMSSLGVVSPDFNENVILEQVGDDTRVKVKADGAGDEAAIDVVTLVNAQGLQAEDFVL